jgi:hypothetical protein
MKASKSAGQILLVLLAVGAVVMAGAAPVAAQENSTEMQEQTESSTTCNPDGPPELDAARLQADDTTIERGDPGKVAGGFQVDPTYECDVVVNVRLQVPSGMSIEGTTDAFSGGAGMVSGSFTLSPNQGIRDIDANVYSQETGEKTVTAYITAWPEGHKDMATELDGIALRYDVVEASSDETTPTEPETETETPGGDPPGPTPPWKWVLGGFFGLLGLSIVGLIISGKTIVDV